MYHRKVTVSSRQPSREKIKDSLLGDELTFVKFSMLIAACKT